jgi:hypothetical protein
MKRKLLGKPSFVGKQQLNIYPADCCVAVALLCNFLILLGDPLRNNAIVSLGSRGLILATIVFSAFQAASAIKEKKTKYVQYVVLLVDAIAISAVLCGPAAILNRMVRLVCFCMLPAYMLLYKDVCNVKLLQKAIYVFNWVCTVLWTLLSFSWRSHIFYGEYSAITLDDLTLGYANPNQTAMMLMVSFVIAFSAHQRDISKKQKALYLLQCIWTLYLLYQTDSRTCIIIAGVMLALWVTHHIPKIGKGFVTFIFFLPLIMAFLLLFGGENVRDMLIMGEELDTGRTDIFRDVLGGLTLRSFVFGDYARWLGENLHNSYLSIFASLGVVGLTTYLVFFWKMIMHYFERVDRNSMPQMIAFLGILGVIAHGGSEATFLISGMVYGSMVGLLLVLTLKENDEK